MRLNAVPPGSVTAPEVRGEVGSVAATRAIGSQGAGATLAAPQGPGEAPAPAPTRPAVERRRVERRVDERRKQKLPVLLDMRGRPRRKARRRTDDETPPSIDTKA